MTADELFQKPLSSICSDSAKSPLDGLVTASL